jgi:hypothetical protein
MTEPIVAFRGTKTFAGQDVNLVFVDHNDGDTLEIVASSDATELGRIYVNAKVLYAAILAHEAEKYTVSQKSLSSSSASKSSTDAVPMAGKDLRNVAVQLLIDALVPGAAGEGTPVLGPVAVAGLVPDDPLTLAAPPLDVLLAAKPDTVTPFADAVDPGALAGAAGGGASGVADVLAAMVADAAALDATGDALRKNSAEMSDMSSRLNAAFQHDILSAFGAQVLEEAVQDIVDDATVRRPRRGGPGAETMTELAVQYTTSPAPAVEEVKAVVVL